MQIYSTYSVKIKHYNHIFKDTVSVYRDAVDFFDHRMSKRMGRHYCIYRT